MSRRCSLAPVLGVWIAAFPTQAEPAPPPPELECRVLSSAGGVAAPKGDALFKILVEQSDCPGDVFELRDVLVAKGLSVRPSLVSNHGFRNLQANAFVRAMLFEEVTGDLDGETVSAGDFFFGHFLGGPQRDRLDALQDSDLIVEALAWDGSAGAFNFYELIAQPAGRRWFFRGDSLDIARDLQELYRAPVSPAGFSLRCSGCHANGGPIMKELQAPHNDWWRESRPMGLDGVSAEERVRPLLRQLVDAGGFAASVSRGVDRLMESPRYRQALSAFPLRQRLLPLFCPLELNLASDPGDSTAAGREVRVPAEFFVDARLGGDDSRGVVLARSHYEDLLERSGSRFSDGGLRDADHSWLVPVKAYADKTAVAALVSMRLIGDEFVADVLAVDMTNPVLSPARCGLVNLLPEEASPGWEAEYRENLAGASSSAAAELLRNLSDPAMNVQHHHARAKRILSRCAEAFSDAESVEKLFRLLQQRRREVGGSPLEQSLEEGFRTVFPTVTDSSFVPRPQALVLNDSCKVVTRP